MYCNSTAVRRVKTASCEPTHYKYSKIYLLITVLWTLNLHTVAVLKSVIQDSLVSIATHYGLDGPGIESRWWKFIRTRLDRPCYPPNLLNNGSRVSFRGKKGPAWLWPLTAISAEVNPLNAELNPICYLLALLAHHFLHVSRIRVKPLTLRLLMSYIYIYGAPILDVSRSHTTTHHSR